MESKKIKIILFSFLLLAAIGIGDSLYLTKKHYAQQYTCSFLETNNCESVLTSSYSTIYDIPIALIGAIYYLIIFASSLIYLNKKSNIARKLLIFLPALAFAYSAYLLYLQFFVLRSICQYCLVSVATSTIIFILSLIFAKSKKTL